MINKIATREGFGKEIAELGKTNPKIMMVSADLEDATRAEIFKKAFPERFFSVGIAEQDMVGMAAGFTFHGFIPVINSFAVFLTNRAYDMLRLDVCYNKRNVKIVCSHAGVTVGPLVLILPKENQRLFNGEVGDKSKLLPASSCVTIPD